MKGNLLANLPAMADSEQFETLVESKSLRVERIVSHGQASPPGFWYDQPRHEIVLLLRGAARLRFDSDECPIDLRPGDYVDIPAGRRHRVEWTTPDEPTVWLAIHFVADSNSD